MGTAIVITASASWWLLAVPRAGSIPEFPIDSPSVANPELVSADRSRESSEDWVSALKRGKVVQFVKGQRDSGGVHPDDGLLLQPLPPPLIDAEKSRLASAFERVVGANASRLAIFRQSMDPASEDDLLTEAGLERTEVRNRSAIQALLSDDYVILPAGASHPTTIPDGAVLSRNMATHADQSVEVVLYMRYERYPELRAANDRVAQMQAFWEEAKCARFNTESLAERMRRVSQHDEAVNRFKQGPSEPLEGEALSRWQESVLSQRLPRGIIVDRRTYLARTASAARR